MQNALRTVGRSFDGTNGPGYTGPAPDRRRTRTPIFILQQTRLSTSHLW
jgi:hypothetical protein